MSAKLLREEFPIHWLVWHNEFKELDEFLNSNQGSDLERVDPHGRTALMLAVTLGHVETTKILLQHNANVNTENKSGWTIVQEAVATGDPELLQLVLEWRDFQRYSSRLCGIPELLAKLRDAPDFYVEMKWEFTSWVPLVSRMCPSDTYKVYKSGSNVRIDTTLLGFDQTSWQRGNRSYVFKGQSDSAVMMEIDHDTKQVYVEQMHMASDDVAFMRPPEDVVSARLTGPIVTTYVDTDKISFERNKSGIWGWRSDKVEPVNGHECKVYNANNVELVTKTRTEHLTEADKARNKSPKSPLQSFLGIAESEERMSSAPLTNGELASTSGNPCNISPEEYFNSEIDLRGKDIGRPVEMTIKTQKFKANLWLCDDYPLSLPEQIMPIVDLMAINSSHFAKLKDFITLQLPAGFPVKIEIPLFHVLNARITFGNIFSMDESVSGVTCLEEDNRVSCVLDDICFEPPSGYMRLDCHTRVSPGPVTRYPENLSPGFKCEMWTWCERSPCLTGSDLRRQFAVDEDDELLQFAIQQSLMDAGCEDDQVTIWEALKNQRPSRPSTPDLPNDAEQFLQRAIQESLALSSSGIAVSNARNDDESQINSRNEFTESVMEDQLKLALALSAKEQQEAERQRNEEEEIMRRILELSLIEK
uniref:Ankyrin repeat domain-containing protein n=1 Tax=Strigamia maritima TaxID=126957 RepID=T1IXD5_STRMM